MDGLQSTTLIKSSKINLIAFFSTLMLTLLRDVSVLCEFQWLLNVVFVMYS
jgi:hypothetical protein